MQEDLGKKQRKRRRRRRKRRKGSRFVDVCWSSLFRVEAIGVKEELLLFLFFSCCSSSSSSSLKASSERRKKKKVWKKTLFDGEMLFLGGTEFAI